MRELECLGFVHRRNSSNNGMIKLWWSDEPRRRKGRVQKGPELFSAISALDPHLFSVHGLTTNAPGRGRRLVDFTFYSHLPSGLMAGCQSGCRSGVAIFIAKFRSALILATFLAVLPRGLAATHVYYWGDNASVKTNPPAATNLVSITGGDDHILGLRADGMVLSWGINTYGAKQVPTNLANVVAIAAGSSHSLALVNDGTVRFWGSVYTTGVKTLPPALSGEVIALAQGCSAQNILAQRCDTTLLDCGNPSYGLTNVPPSASNVVALAVGSFYAVALRADGRVVQWGDWRNIPYPPTPIQPPPANATNLIAIAGGIGHVLGLRSDGNLALWSANGMTIPAAATNIVAIACGGFHCLALRADGKLLAWGDNSSGQLNIPPGLSNIVGIAGTTAGSLVLTADDGPPLLGQILLNPAIIGSNARLKATVISTTPVSYQWFLNGVAVSDATNSSLLLTNVQFSQAGSYSLVVSNAFGSATNSDLNFAVQPVGFTMQPQSSTNLAGGTASFSASALGPGPMSYQWRLNGVDLAGATTTSLTLTNLQMSDAGLYSVAVSNSFGGVLSSNASLTVVPFVITSAPNNLNSFPGATVTLNVGVLCNFPVSYQWQFDGASLDGAVGSSLTLTNLQFSQAGVYAVNVSAAGTTVSANASLNITPLAAIGGNWNGMASVPWGLTNLVAVANGNAHTVALLSDGSVQGWGISIGFIPAGLTNVIAVSAGEEHSLVLNADGTVNGWGGLTPPPGLSNIVAVACGFYHSMALRSDGTVLAWGSNSYGQTNVPAGLTNVVAIKAGEYHSLALTSDGHVIAWGAGTRNTGIYPNVGQSLVPPWLSNVVAIAAGSEFSLALCGDGTVTAWGWNNAGETNVPAGLSNVIALATGWQNAIALRADGTVVAWGNNFDGETNVPAGLTNVNAVFDSDGPYTCALVGQTPPIINATLLNPSFGNDGFSFSFPSQSDRVYLIEYKVSLTDTDWTPLPLVPGSGHLLTVIDPTGNGGQRFYRIRRW